MNRFFKTVTFRLTFWYAVLFSTASLITFAVIYIYLEASLTQRVDMLLRQEGNELEILFRQDAPDVLREGLRREAEAMGTQRMFFRIYSSSGKILATSNEKAWRDIHHLRTAEDFKAGHEILESIKVPRHKHPIRVISREMDSNNIMQICNTLHDDDELLEAYRRVSVTAVLALLMLGGLVGWFMARRAMSGVERVTRTAVQIGKADMVSRVPLGDEGIEINNLALAFNDMLSRIQVLLNELKDVTNNIAHDLRSPLTRIRGLAEMTLTGEQDIRAYRDMAGVVIEESDSLVAMINIMLEIAMTESGMQTPGQEKIDAAQLFRRAYDLFHVLAEDKDIGLEILMPEEPAVLRGSIPQIQRMIGNLLDNAIKFTPRGGRIEMRLEKTSEGLAMSIMDTGIGIPEHDLPRIFERFYRGDRSRTEPGNGLGLSHVAAIARSHGGRVTVESTPGKGSVFTVVLPSAERPAGDQGR